MRRICLFTVLLTALLYGGVAIAEETESKVPAFGSQYAGEMSLDAKTSDVLPKKTLSEPGILAGHWISKSTISQVKVSGDYERTNDGTVTSKQPGCEYFPRDCFVLTFPADDLQPCQFVAAYESFVVYELDVDGDGLDELIIESGKGRGTSVLERFLTIFKLYKDGYHPIFHVQLNGYLWAAREPEIDGYNPPTWERQYSFKRNAKNKTLDIVVSLFPPRAGVKSISDMADLFSIQATKIVAKYNKKRQTYEIDNVKIKPIR